MATLKAINEAYDYYSTSASNSVRTLAFSGIAAIWIFCKIESGHVSIPSDLIIPLVLYLLSLLADLFHYVVAAYVYENHLASIQKEFKGKGKQLEEDTEVRNPRKVTNKFRIIYYAKILLLTAGLVWTVIVMLYRL